MSEEKCVVYGVGDSKIKEMITLLEAYRKGEKIEVSYKRNGTWESADNPSWNFADFNYRIKQTPTNAEVVAEKLREIGFDVDTYILKRGCPVPYSKEYSSDYQCGCSVKCSSCKEWWDEPWKGEKE